ncbi:hypothetical protein [Intrasporangium calvum]|uniref:Lipoprotein n=1 Tax=Intrasporangium calvum (strain ATCC 23552 / DSM 43043 / JCM 3097 / NBRC 12989 / NCIMB 10167 / NRRL B-3866 / 7 KIP) TaxID=710696 RepID=E6S8L0_INTC7|nr:hypothetical protein [Intrasporangium calvum]ADU49172.1 hypothetical protein Intca_2669 [Intrasporangium calvum DSM 43043]
MNRTTLTIAGVSVLLTAAALTGCASTSTSPPGPGTAAASASTAPTAGSTAGGTSVVLPVTANPIANTATDPTLQITYAAVEDNVDPSTKKAISDRLEITLKNTGTKPLTGFEIYYEMTDLTTGTKEGYYQKLDGLTVAAGTEQTIYFDNETGPGHYPENQFSIYRSSTNQVDFTIQVSASGAKIATGTATKSVGTGEKSD